MKLAKKICETALASSLAFTIGFVSCSPDIETKEVIKTEIVEVEKEVIVEVDKKTDEAAPANVTNLAATNKDGAILLTWTDNSTDSDIYGYEVTYSSNTSSRVALNPISNTSIMVAQGTGGCYVYNLTNGTEYTFTVKSVDTSDNKSKGVTINATPCALNGTDTMKIELSTPQELTNTTIIVTAKIINDSIIKKVVYKKNGSVNAATLLEDGEARIPTQSNPNDNTTWTFVADETAFWTLAAIDEYGREEAAQIYTHSIDKTPPKEVSNICSQHLENQNSIKITWNDPSDTNDQYDSPFDHVIVTYTVDDNTEVMTVNQTVAKGTETIEITGIDSSANCYQLLIHTVDMLGNTSKGKLSRCYIGNTIIATADNVVEKIANMTQSGTVKVTGALTSFNDIRSAVKELSSDIRIKLDFSETEASQLDPYFKDCKNLDSIILPNGITTINCSAFSNCTSLSSVTIPNSVTYIDSYAFLGCSSLTTVAIPESVTYIGPCAFEKCVSLTSINIPDSVTSILGQTFYGCSSLSSITIPDSVTTIEYYAFLKCSSLSSVTIPDSVTTIGSKAFYGCTSLTTLTIPTSVTSIEDDAFSYLINLYYKGTIEDWLQISGYSNAPFSAVKHFYIDDSEVTELIIPEGVTTIRDYAFFMFKSLISVTISDSVTSIGQDAFAYCSSLTSVSLPNSITTIKSRALKISDYYDTLSYLYYTGTIESWLEISCDPWALQNTDHFYINNSEVTDLVIPDGVSTIRNNAFYGFNSITSVTIPNSVTTIGDDSFSFCKSLTNVIIPNSVTSIGDMTFYQCSSLATVTIGNGMTSIGYDAFVSCDKLETVNYRGTQDQWENISIAGMNYLTSANINYNYTGE